MVRLRGVAVACAVLLAVAGCRPAEYGPLEFDATVLEADQATADQPAPVTPTLVVVASATPVASLTPLPRTATPVATSVASTPTQFPSTPTAEPKPTAQPEAAIPSVAPTPPRTPVALASPLPGVTPLPMLTPEEVSASPPGAGQLVYQAFWASGPASLTVAPGSGGAPGIAPAIAPRTAGGWISDRPVSTENGMLIFHDWPPGLDGPTFAEPGLPNAALAVVAKRDYMVQATLQSDNPTTAAFGVFLRSGAGPPQSADYAGPGQWRAGVVGASAFVLGESILVGSQTPRALLLTRAVASKDFTQTASPITFRFIARGHRYSLQVGDRLAFAVEDTRFDGGSSIGVWADHTEVKVLDFRLYALAE